MTNMLTTISTPDTYEHHAEIQLKSFDKPFVEVEFTPASGTNPFDVVLRWSFQINVISESSLTHDSLPVDGNTRLHIFVNNCADHEYILD